MGMNLLQKKSLALFLLPASWGWADAGVDFNREVRPILSEHCFACHGPDAKNREADLRLDTFEGATRDLGGHAALVPGRAETSAILQRVLANDPKERMPRKGPPLREEQIAVLRRWINGGGTYSTHWSFEQPVQVSVPAKVHPVDHFVSRVHKAKGMTFSPVAPPEKLVRRFYLDLIGLSPSPAEVADFRVAYAADADAAVEEVVDRLLASPRFGERWARGWLDLARYADSNGFQADQLRPSWAFRDWVIDSMNANQPFDLFSIDQLAGDLLSERSVAQRVATGFHRTPTCNVEAGVHPEENRVNQVFDRVNTTGTVWLGLTMECAQCHDHKYDPITMKDYYSLFAFFNNTPLEVSKPSGTNDVSHDFIGPFMDLPLPSEKETERQAFVGQLAQLNREKAGLDTEQGGQKQWEQETLAAFSKEDALGTWMPLPIATVETTGGETWERTEAEAILFTGQIPEVSNYTLESGALSGTNITAVKIEALTHPSLPGNGPGRGDVKRNNIVLKEVEIAQGGEAVVVGETEADFSQSKWPVAGLVDGSPKTGWAIAPQFSKPHWAILNLVKPVSVSPEQPLRFVLVQDYGGGRVIGHLRLSVRLGGRPGTIDGGKLVKLLKKPPGKRTKDERGFVEKAWQHAQPKRKLLQGAIATVERKLSLLKPDKTLVMQELETPRPTTVLRRGSYLSPGEQVTPDTPEVLFPMPEAGPGNRVGLARWLVSRENPLTARVAVNRWWSELFGHGIVTTPEDFGTQGAYPTFPELLDWLAVDLMESGWDRKALIRRLVLSRTYQQDSVLSQEALAQDPSNTWLARASRFRVDAERVRDNALAVSGLLSDKMHGVPIMPYQPPGMWRQTGRNEPKWVESKTEDRWRRGIYIVYRRAAPYPSMVNFDAPDRGACTVQRPRTNTPLQALTLLNDPAYGEMALALADRILTESSEASLDARIDYAMKLACGRKATAKEKVTLSAFVTSRQLTAAQAKVIVAGASSVYKAQHPDVVELATWYFVGNVLLNLDETITRS